MKRAGLSDKQISDSLAKQGYKKGKDGKYYKHIKGSMEFDPEEFSFGDLSGDLSDATSDTDSLNNKIKESIKIFERFKDVTQDKSLTGNKLLANMKSQIDGARNWAADLSKLKGKISAEFYKELLDEGVSSYDKVIELQDMSSAQLAYANTLYEKRTTDALNYTVELSNGIIDLTQSDCRVYERFSTRNQNELY